MVSGSPSSFVFTIGSRPSFRALRSCLSQGHPSLEVVVIDDGSADGTAQVLVSIEDSRVRVVTHLRTVGSARPGRSRGLVPTPDGNHDRGGVLLPRGSRGPIEDTSFPVATSRSPIAADVERRSCVRHWLPHHFIDQGKRRPARCKVSHGTAPCASRALHRGGAAGSEEA